MRYFEGLKLAADFLKLCLRGLSKRGFIFAVMNVFCFCSLFVATLVSQFQYPLPYEGAPVVAPEFLVDVPWPLMIVGIFLFNLVLSGFVVVTLSGLVFFPLSAVVLVYRMYLWGVLLGQLSTFHFLAVLPTLVLEAEGYVMASVAGIILGLSWVKPGIVYGGVGLSRLRALRKAFRECARMYVFVAVLLLAAAIVETVTLAFLL